jgi:hypothetical protein
VVEYGLLKTPKESRQKQGKKWQMPREKKETGFSQLSSTLQVATKED